MEIVADDRSMDLAKVIRGETRLNDNVIITSDVQRNVGARVSEYPAARRPN